MNQKIVTRPFNFGDEKEASWPPRFGTGGTGVYHMKDGVLVEGPPPPREVYDRAPAVIQDTIEPYYHPTAQTMVDSRSRLNAIDEACGTITTDKLIPPDPSRQNRANRERREDLRRALHKSVAQLEAGTAPLTEEQRATCDRNNQLLQAAYPHLDVFNAVGRVTDARGKRFKRRRKRSKNTSS